MRKRIAIVGRGTAGTQSIIHFLRHAPHCEIEWYFDPKKNPQSVGEGSTLNLPTNLFENLNFNYLDLEKIDATIKLGIYKSGWGKNQNEFLHQFSPPSVAFHFNAISLQNYIFDLVKDKVTIFEEEASPENIDADHILDCSGKPESYDEFNKASYIPVNSAYITQCYWEYPRFQYTLTIARPYGWVFGIPLKNRCSIGYIYNSDINTLDEVKEDVKQIFEEYNLTPSDNTNSLSFKNYYRKQNYSERVIYNGNASFFLEPLEATSIGLMDLIQRSAFDIWIANEPVNVFNINYKKLILEIETIIMIHYFAGSKYDTKFWNYAQERGEKCLESRLKNDSTLSMIIDESIIKRYTNNCAMSSSYGGWIARSFCENIFGLGIDEKLSKMIRDI